MNVLEIGANDCEQSSPSPDGPRDEDFDKFASDIRLNKGVVLFPAQQCAIPPAGLTRRVYMATYDETGKQSFGKHRVAIFESQGSLDRKSDGARRAVASARGRRTRYLSGPS